MKELNDRLYDLEHLTSLKLVGKDFVATLKKHCGDRALKAATEKLSKLEGEYLSTKLMEAVLESGPQFILQLSIIFKVKQVISFNNRIIWISCNSCKFYR